MPAARLPIVLDRAGGFSQTFTWLDDAGNPQVIGGQQAFFTIYDGMTGQTVCELTSTDGAILVEPNAATGQVAVTAASTDTAAIKKTAMYLLQLVAANGKPTDIFYGPVRVGWRGMGVN